MTAAQTPTSNREQNMNNFTSPRFDSVAIFVTANLIGLTAYVTYLAYHLS